MFRLHKTALTSLLVSAAFASATASTEARMFKHVDPDTGVVTYSNLPLRAPNRPPSPPSSAPAATMPRPVAIVTLAPSSSTSIEPRKESGPATTGGMFPKISAATQRERDKERVIIIAEELRDEEDALREAIAGNASQVVIRRYQTNIAALKREIERIR